MKRHPLLITGLLLASLLGSFVHAATVTVNWTPPTANTDGSAIPSTGAGSLTTYRIEYGTCAAGNAFGTKAGEVSRPAPASSGARRAEGTQGEASQLLGDGGRVLMGSGDHPAT